jgi:hypothetical protein
MEPKPKLKKIEPVNDPKEESAKTEPKQETKVLVVNFEKPAKKEEKQEVEKTPPPPKEEKAELVPVSDKLAGVQADDSQTEAAAPDMNQNPTDGDSATTMESMEKGN